MIKGRFIEHTAHWIWLCLLSHLSFSNLNNLRHAHMLLVSPSVIQNMMKSDVKATEIYLFFTKKIGEKNYNNLKQFQKMCSLDWQTHGCVTWFVSAVAWSRWNRQSLTKAFGISSISLDCCPDPLSLVRTVCLSPHLVHILLWLHCEIKHLIWIIL